MRMRWQAIKYDRAGNAYITHRRCKYELHEFIRPSYPLDTVLERHGLVVHGVYCIAAGLVVGVHISDDGEQAKVFFMD